MKILAIDPGPERSQWLLLDGERIVQHAHSHNEDLIGLIHLFRRDNPPDLVACEMVASYGMPVGKDVFETCVWIGRFRQCAGDTPFRFCYRKDIKMHLCGSMRAKDGNIRQRLIDLVGPQGTKRAPGPTYGVSKHAWAALAVAVFARETK